MSTQGQQVKNPAKPVLFPSSKFKTKTIQVCQKIMYAKIAFNCRDCSFSFVISTGNEDK